MTDNANFWQLLVIGSYMGWSLRAACAVDIEETGQRGLEHTGDREILTQVPYLLIGLRRKSWGLVD